MTWNESPRIPNTISPDPQYLYSHCYTRLSQLTSFASQFHPLELSALAQGPTHLQPHHNTTYSHMASSHRLLPSLATRTTFRYSSQRSTFSSTFRYKPSQLQATQARKVHVAATPSTTALEHPTDLTEYTQAIPKLSGAGPFPAG
jgi:hypothetical protein